LPSEVERRIEPRPAEGYALYLQQADIPRLVPQRALAGDRLSTGIAAMMADRVDYYSMLARARLMIRNDTLAALGHFLGRVPILRSIGRRAKRGVGKILLPEEFGWVKVERGLAKGTWLRLRLLGEGSYWLGHHEVAVQELLERLCKPGCVFYDIGANIGFFSFGVANCAGPQGRVFAFEPEPENCVRLKEMVVRNNLQSRVEVVEAAVWSYTSSSGVPFRRGSSKAHGGVLADGIEPVLADGELQLVPAIRLDDFLRKGKPGADVVKIDVEGGECEVLKGAEELFSRYRPALLGEIHHERAAQWITEWLLPKGYVAEWRVPKELYPRLLLGQPARSS
jgi:FkbM family methyltransferase